jgi:hypothetical protein
MNEYVKSVLTLLTIQGKVSMVSQDRNIAILSTIVEKTKSGFDKYAIEKRGIDNNYFIETQYTLKAMSDFSVSMQAELSVRKSKSVSETSSLAGGNLKNAHGKDQVSI